MITRINGEVCNYDCFNCGYPDCINNDRPTQKEREMAMASVEPWKKAKKRHVSGAKGGRWSS